MPEPPAVEVTGLVKRYAGRAVVDGVSFRAEAGAVTAVLGPNGAGKTTTLEICEGFRREDAGHVRVLGSPPLARGLRARVGVMLQTGGAYPAARPMELLRHTARLYADPMDPDALLGRLGLTDTVRTPYRRLSGGQQQRLGLAMAVVGRPDLVFLDEPTAGLDPQARRAAWAVVEELREAGTSVVLTTHYLDEAERLADHVVVLDAGHVVAAGTPAELTRGGAERSLRFRAVPGLPVAELAGRLGGRTAVAERQPGHYVVEGDVGPALVAAVAAWCAEREVLIDDLRLEQRSLEDVFLELTGDEVRP